MVTLSVNGRTLSVDVDPDTPLIYVLRNDLALNGPKLGCGSGLCGACTVHVDGRAVRSCQTPVSALAPQRQHRHARGPGYARAAPSAADGLYRRAGRAVRLLHQRHDHGGGGPARGDAKPERGGDPPAHEHQPVPLRLPAARRARHSARRPRRECDAMTISTELDAQPPRLRHRRRFCRRRPHHRLPLGRRAGPAGRAAPCRP